MRISDWSSDVCSSDLACSRQNNQLSHRLRNFDVFRVETERTRHTATAAVEHRRSGTQHFKQGVIALGAKERLLMAVGVYKNGRIQFGRPVATGMQKVTQQRYALRQLLGTRVVGQQLEQLFFETRQTARLKSDQSQRGRPTRSQKARV